MQLTVLGGSGFIGGRLIRRLDGSDWQVWAPDRSAGLASRPLGHVVYAIGVTGDFRNRVLDTVEAHVCRVLELLSTASFESLTYLSSTRVYSHNSGPAHESDPISGRPEDAGDLYNLSKALAECLLLSSERQVRVLRLSNVYGFDPASRNFLPSIIREAIATGTVRLETSLDSERDYVSVDDVVDVIIRTLTDGSHQIYNVAGGVNISNRTLGAALAQLVEGEIVVKADAPSVRQPPIGIERLVDEFDFRPRMVLDDLPALVAAYRQEGDRL